MKNSILLILSIAFLGFSAKLPELHDTTIAVFPNTNPGDSLRFREIFYDGVVEKLECYAIGKTIFPFKITNVKSKDTFPEFDSASILVSGNLKNIMDTTNFSPTNYYSLVNSYPSILRTDTETIIKSVGGGTYTTYCQCHGLAIVFSFVPNKHEGVSSGAIDNLRPALVVRDIFKLLPPIIPATTKTIAKRVSIATKNNLRSSRTFLLNGREIQSTPSVRAHNLIKRLIIPK